MSDNEIAEQSAVYAMRIMELEKQLAEAKSKALLYDMDKFGIDHRSAEAVEFVECRAQLAEARKALLSFRVALNHTSPIACEHLDAHYAATLKAAREAKT